MTAVHKQNITQVINTYSKRLMGFIRQRVSREADAEDILQDVFYQLADTVTPIEQVSGWLFKVARNKITDQQRKRKPDLFSDVYAEEDGEETMDWGEFLFEAVNNPETEYLRSMFWETLDAALNELPAEQRQVFVLNEMEGVSV